MDEEEKKKRLERARQIANSITENDYNTNFNKIVLNNLQGETDEEKEYINKFNKAREITNSINPRENVLAPHSSEEERQKSIENAQPFLDLIDGNIDTSDIQENAEDTNNTEEKTKGLNSEQLNAMSQSNAKNINEKLLQERLKNDENKDNINVNQNITSDISSNNISDSSKVSDLQITSLKDSASVGSTSQATMTDVKAMQEANKKNEDIAKGGVDAFNEWADTVLNNARSGYAMKPIAGLVNIVTTITGLGLKGLEKLTSMFGFSESANKLNEAYNKTIDIGSEINKRANYTSEVTNQIDSDFIKTSGQVTDVIFNMLGNSSIGYVTGISGTVAQGLSVGGSSAQEVLDENKDNIEKATITGIAKGYVSYLTEEMFDANILTRGSRKTSIQSSINRLIANKISSDIGKEFANKTVGIIGENLEELVEDNADYLIDKLVNNKDLPGFQEWWDNTTETAKTTTLSTMIMGLLGLGGESFKNVENDIETEYWIDKAKNIIEQEDLAIHFNPEQTKSISNMQDFYVTQFNQDGEISNVITTKGKEIDNPNKDLNITPVIVKDSKTNYYNVIDGNTGVVLDSTYYSNLTEAENSFNEKVSNLTDNQLKDINNQVNKASYTITNDIMKTITTAQEQIIQSESQEATKNVDYLQNFNDVKELTNQISDNSIYNKASTEDILELVSDKINNVHLIEQSGISYLNSLDKEGNVVYQQKVNSPIYTGKKIKSIIVNATQNADLSNINQTQSNNTNIPQTSQKAKSSNFYTNTTNYAVEDIKKVTEPFKSKKSYTKNELAEIWNDEINEKLYDTLYYDNGDVKSYIAIEEDGKNLIVNQYDEDDNVVKSEVIEKTNNGRYTSEAVTTAIEKASSIYDENKPIKGQVDIEGNEVRSLKKKNTNNYTNFKELIKQEEKNAILNFQPSINITISKDIQNIKLKDIKQSEAIKIAKSTFKENNNRRIFKNQETGDNIKVVADDIKESIHKTFTNKNQKKYLRESIASFSKIDSIIENGKKVSEASEQKNRNIYKSWNYYITQAVIDNKPFLIEFDVALEEDGWHFRVERLKEINKKVDTPLATTKKSMLIQGKSTSINNSITQNKNSVKNTAVNNNMQNNENNTSKSLKANAPQNDENKNTDILNANSTSFTVEEEKQIKKELHNRIQNSLLSKNSNKNTYLGKVSNKVASKVKSLFGIDITDRTHLLTDNDIRHMIKQHGNPEIEKAKGQIAITTKDIEKIPDILNSYDSIIQGSDNKQGKTLRYIKNYPNNQTYVVEVIPNANDKNLYIKTMWKKAIKNKKEPVTLTNNQKTPSSTSETRGNSGSNTSIPQSSENVKNDGIRYMKKSNSKSIDNNTQKITDNQGRKLSKQQQEYFKNSIVRDENGNLKTLYHGTDAEFTIFDYKYLGKNGTSLGKGFYLTDDINTAKGYAERENGKVMEVYADIQKPLSYGKTTMSADEYIKFVEAINEATEGQLFGDYSDGVKIIKGNKQYNEMLNQFEQDYSYGGDDIDLVSEILNSANLSLKDGYKILKKTLGYDGIVSDKGFLTNEGTVYIPLLSEQIKNVNNTNPTSNEDIRFAKRTAKSENVTQDKTKLNAEREGAYIEQEIQKIEETGNWDNSIPVTRMTDIRKTIEDYLGLGIKKGHFRERAYALYKGKRDVIRTKEFKDMDSILHETGHALDIGNRLKLDKESIADELLKAVDKYGGYETETRSVKLEEGFAEVIREYSIIPEQAKIDYPQSVTVIEQIRQNDTSFNNFISKIQQQTYNYIHQNPKNRTLSNMSIGEQTDKKVLSKAWIEQEAMRNIYDKDYALKSAVKELAKANGKTMNDVKASENAYYLVRLSNGIGQKVSSMLSNGYIDENGNKLMPGLNQIGEILGNDPERFNDLRAYLVAQRDIEYKAKELKTGIRTTDSQNVIAQFKNDTQIQEASQLIYDTLNGVMQYAVDNGLISQETADDLKGSNAFYVPMQRVLENRGNQVGKRGAVADIIKTRKGSELDVKDVLENIIANSSNIIQQVENNNILKALYKQGEGIGLTGAIYDVITTPMIKTGTAQLSLWEDELKKQGVNTNDLDLEKTIDLFAPNNKVDTKNLITSFINDDGKRVYLQFNDELIFNSIMNMDKTFMSQVLNINSKMNMPLRYGATMANLGFAIPNMISDTAQATIYSTAGFIPVVDNALGVMDILTATNSSVKKFMDKVAPDYVNRINALYTIYEQTGATSSTRLSQYRKSTQEIMKEVYGTNKSETLGIEEKFKPLKRLLDLMTYIPEISEQSTRFEVFKKNYDYYKTKGTSETDARIQAALESRDATQDFGRTGNITREINQLIPFSAARVGSAYTFAEKVTANPKKVGMRIAILTAIAMGIKAIGYDDDEIEELNQRKKDDNFVLPFGSDVLTIKKPQGILRSIINLAEYIQDLATGHIEEGKEGERLGEWLNNAIMDNMPADSVTGLVPNMVAPLIENAINKDFYYNTDIVSSYDLDLPNDQQYYEYNSQLAILLGKVFNYSPAKIDNLISGYFGGLGTSVTGAMDYIMGKLGLSAEKAEMGAESNTIGKRFVVNVNSNSASLDEIYDRKTELTKLKNGGTITEEETEELETLTEAISNISKLNKQIKSIKADLTMSGTEKAEQIKELQKQRTDTARQALGKDLIYDENASKIETTKFYPANSTLSKSGYTLTLTDSLKEEYAELASSYYSKYESQGIYSEEKLEDIKSKAKDYAKNELFKKYKSSLVKKSTN